MMDVCRRNRTQRSRRTSRRNSGQVCLLLASIGFTLLILCPGALADQVTMANGDVITGEILTLEGGKLKVKTPYNAALELDWASVKSVRSDVPVELVLEDDRHVKGTLETSPDGTLQVVTESAGPVPIGAPSLVTGMNPPEVKWISYTGDVLAGASYLTGNTETASFSLSGKFVAKTKRHRGTLRGAWYYAEDKKLVTARRLGGSAKYDFFITEKLYAYLNGLLEYDAFQDLDLRATLGPGIGYQFFDNDRLKLAGEVGYSYVSEDFNIAPDNEYSSARWSIDFNWDIVKKKIALFHFDEGYISVEDSDNFYFRSEQGLRFNVWKNFGTTFQANIDYNNAPSPGKDKTDTALIFGLTYNYDI